MGNRDISIERPRAAVKPASRMDLPLEITLDRSETG